MPLFNVEPRVLTRAPTERYRTCGRLILLVNLNRTCKNSRAQHRQHGWEFSHTLLTAHLGLIVSLQHIPLTSQPPP